MEIQLVRNATMRIRYAGRLLVTDPYLAAKHTRPSVTGKSLNPTSDLPCTPEEAVAGADIVILSHIHSDHFDQVGQRVLQRGLPIICQPHDENALRGKGFTNLQPVDSMISLGGIKFTRIPGMHGSGEVLREMGETSGFVIEAAGEPIVYWLGDTILSDGVREALGRFRPDVVLTHSCGAVWKATPIVMNAEETIEICRLLPLSKVIAVHMDAVDHAMITRSELRAYADAHGTPPGRLFIPENGEVVKL
jgi:L-ascorbate metabolism protein UlaG (beta-lactamase superfamily)